MSQASAVTAPRAPGPDATGSKPKMDGPRGRIRGGPGFSYDGVAIEVSHRHPVRPHQPYRLAWGRALDQRAAQFNELAGEGTGPEGRAGMTGLLLCKAEKWPGSERKPSAYALCLLDPASPGGLTQRDRLFLMRRQRAESPVARTGVPPARLTPVGTSSGESAR